MFNYDDETRLGEGMTTNRTIKLKKKLGIIYLTRSTSIEDKIPTQT